MYEIGCTIQHLRQTSPWYSPATTQSCRGRGGGAGRRPCVGITSHRSAPAPPAARGLEGTTTPLPCAAPGVRGTRWCRCLPRASQVRSRHAVAAHKLLAYRVASPLLAVASFNMVIYLPRGWLAWMEDLAVSEDMFLFTGLMTKLAKRIKRFSLGYSVNQGCTSD